MVDQGPMDDDFKRKCIGTELVFAWLPKTCTLTGKRLWFTHAYKQTAMWTGPGESLFEYRWYKKEEFLIASIKGTV